MKVPARMHKWRYTRSGLLIVGLAGLALAAAVMLHAFDTGSLWQYFIAFLFLACGLQNLTKFTRTFLRGPGQNRTS